MRRKAVARCSRKRKGTTQPAKSQTGSKQGQKNLVLTEHLRGLTLLGARNLNLQTYSLYVDAQYRLFLLFFYFEKLSSAEESFRKLYNMVPLSISISHTTSSKLRSWPGHRAISGAHVLTPLVWTDSESAPRLVISLFILIHPCLSWPCHSC